MRKKAIKVGIIGLGRAGYGMHCKEIDARSSKFKIVAGCDILESKRDRFAELNPKAKIYKDLKDLILDPEVELIDIANRTPDHTKTALLALKSGKDVFLEKPICETYAEAKKLRTASKRAKGNLYLRHNRRFEAAFVHLKEIIGSGVLGDVYEIKLSRHGYSRRNDWQTIKSCGGGQLGNWGPHLVDHGLQLLESPIKEIFSDTKVIAAVGDAEDHLKIILKGKNGRIIDIEISGGVILKSPVYAVYGTKGSLIAGNENTFKLKYLDPKFKLSKRTASKADPGDSFGTPDELKWIEKEIAVSPKQKCSPSSIWDHLFASIRKGIEFPITLDQGVEVMRVIDEVRNRK